MLGETPLPAQPRSVFDFMSEKDRERLESIKNNINAPRPPSPRPVPPNIKGEVIAPQLHPSIAKAALSGFQPFTTDPLKQSRYTAFLQFTSEDTTGRQLNIDRMPGQSIEDFNKELSDYAKAATVFKPLSGAMAGRFRSAVIVENGPKIIEGLHKPDTSASQATDEAMETKEEEDKDPRIAAIRLGMYGPLTREVSSWQPARLLCKRFGVKEPELDPADTADSSKENVHTEAPQPPTPTLAITDGTGNATESVVESAPGQRNLANIGLGEDDTQGQDTLTYQRPAMDIFKAIFASDDEDSEDEEAPAKAVHQEAPDTTPALTVVKTEEMPTAALYETNKPPAEDKVDLATFKPTFIPRADRDSRKEKEKGREKDKKKKPAKTLVSFDDGEEDGGLQVTVKAEKRKDRDKDKGGDRKKKKRKEVKAEEDDDSMWVERPAPEVVRNINLGTLPLESAQDGVQDVAGPPRGRKRAVDFM
jgi:G patch domain-containing protein 1